MNTNSPRCWRSGITLLEVMILLAVLAVLAALLLPRYLRAGSSGSRISCVNNLKQVGLSFRQWGMDHHDKFPMGLAVTNGGTMDHPLAYEPWVHLAILSNELNTPAVLACPEDPQVVTMRAFSPNFGKANVSYFVGLDTAHEAQPQLILTGDRNLMSNNVAIKPGLLVLDQDTALGWTRAIHKRNGNISLADGRVEQMSSERLQQHLLLNPQTNRLAIP